MKHIPEPPEASASESGASQSTSRSGSRLVATKREAHKISRAKLSRTGQITVWVRAGGVCVLCKKYLLEGSLTGLGVSLGELAHNVGQQNSARSPRGQHPLPRERRDDADNVLLACASCHNEIDHQLVAGILDVDRLTQIKAKHERRIRHLVTLENDARTLVLRVTGRLRGEPVEITRSTVASTVTAEGRFPWFDLDRDNVGIDIDLQGLPGETTASTAYFTTACSAIDEVLEHKLHDAVAAGAVPHVSVFAFARMPLLVHLGKKLTDNTSIEVYQRHRDTEQWHWNPDAPTHHFTLNAAGDAFGSSDLVLVINVSGTVNVTKLPRELAGLPRVVIDPDQAPSPDILRSRATLDSFGKVLRELYALFDANRIIRRVHVFGAMPPAPAVELGRLHDTHIHPALALYNLTEQGTYSYALEIS